MHPRQGKKSLPEHKWTHYLLPWGRIPVKKMPVEPTMLHEMADLQSVAHLCGQLTSILQAGTGPGDTHSMDWDLYLSSLRLGLPSPHSTEARFLQNSEFCCTLLDLLQNMSISWNPFLFWLRLKRTCLVIITHLCLLLFCHLGHLFIPFLPPAQRHL